MTQKISPKLINPTGASDGSTLVYTTAGGVDWGVSSAGVTVYSTIDDLPLSGEDAGALGFVSATNRLYLWNGSGWYNIALINTSPSITGGYESSYNFATDGTPIEITLIGTDPEGIPLTWSYEVTNGSLTNGGGTTATVSQADNVFTITPSTNPNYVGVFTITFKASDGVNLGTAAAEFSLAFFVENSKYTSLLVKGLASGDNATFIDDGDNTLTITKNGDVTQGTFSPYRYHSFYFDGSGGDYFRAPASWDFDMDVNEWCMECWIFVEDLSAARYIGSTWQIGGQWTWGVNTNGSLTLGIRDRTATTSAAGVITTNTWYHIAANRDNSGATDDVTLFVDGVAVAVQQFTKGSDFIWYNNAIKDLRIGVGGDAGSPFKGFIHQYRFVIGDSVYGLTDFTPPTEPLTDITGTKIIFGGTPYYRDVSSYDRAVTVVGTPFIEPFGPFDYKKYDPNVNGGSAYFDGSTASLSVPYNSNLTFPDGTDFTIDAWVYRTAAADGAVVASYPGAASGNWIIRISSTGYLQLYIYTPLNWFGGATPQVIPLNTWAHIAVTRSGTTFELFVNGVSCGTTTTTINFGNANPITIGQYNSTMYFPGYISNLRFTSGSAIDFSSTGVPTAPVSGTGTELTLNFTNADILDYSGGNNFTLYGNTAVSTTTKKNAAASLYFDGSGDYLTVPASPDFAFGTGDFTVEAWVYSPDNTRKALFESRSAATSTAGYAFICEDYIRFYSNGWKISTAAMPTNQWAHVAWVRYSGTLYFYLNGQQDTTTYALTNNFTDPLTYTPKICGSSTSGEEWIGYVEDFRVTKGLARYTADFTPPTSELIG